MKAPLVKHTPESIREYVNHYQKSRVLLTAFELDIFTVLSKSSKTSEQVAKKIKTDIRATNRLMNALCALGFLEKTNQKFKNTNESEMYFVKGKTDYMSNLLHTAHQWETWSTLADCVKKGTSVFQRPKHINNRDIKWLESFIGAMHYRASRQAGAIVSKLNTLGVKRVLDVGGGSGAFAMAFTKAIKNSTATVFDLPNVIPITLQYIQKNKMNKKVDVVGGDYHTSALPKGYDLIFLSAVIHINSYEENVKLIKKCASSLNKNGQLVIQDQVMNEERTKPVTGALFALNMLVGTEKGDTYTEKEICQWYKKAGLQFEKRIDIPTGNALIVGRKC